MARIITVFFVFVLSYISCAQQEEERGIKNKKIRSIVQSNRLKDGALLVRLFDGVKQVSNLEKQGKSQKIVKAYKQKVKKENEEIIRAYSNNFSYCPVYFFYHRDSKLVSERQFDQVEFIDINGKIDHSIKFDKPYFYTSEVSTENFEAIIIMDYNFDRLERPFPHYTKTLSSIPLLGRTLDSTVKLMDSKILQFNYKYKDIEIDPVTFKVIIKETLNTK